MQKIGDRMKENYEDRYRFELLRRTPCIIRIDGRAFHSYTRHFEKPFDKSLHSAMCMAACMVALESQGCKAAYIQSDEASFVLTDYDTLKTEPWFGCCKSKVESVAASLFTGYFNQHIMQISYDIPIPAPSQPACFDARAFSIPEAEVCNYFLWRMKDWERNSLSMHCRAHFSDKQMHGKSKTQQHEMLHSIEKNWTTDLPSVWKNGTWMIRHEYDNQKGFVSRTDITPHWSHIDSVLGTLLKPLEE